MAENLSALRVLGALCSLIVPGLGQAFQKRFAIAVLMFASAALLWWFLMFVGVIVHIWSVIDAAIAKPKI